MSTLSLQHVLRVASLLGISLKVFVVHIQCKHGSFLRIHPSSEAAWEGTLQEMEEDIPRFPDRMHEDLKALIVSMREPEETEARWQRWDDLVDEWGEITGMWWRREETELRLPQPAPPDTLASYLERWEVLKMVFELDSRGVAAVSTPLPRDLLREADLPHIQRLLDSGELRKCTPLLIETILRGWVEIVGEDPRMTELAREKLDALAAAAPPL